MGKRRKSRELALQALFYMDMRGDDSDEKLALFLKSRHPSKSSQAFFLELVSGVTRARAQIDAIVERFSSNWKINRMCGVDRNILRVAVYEMLCREDIPVKVSINEAIDIGKKFGTEDSGAFINGILDSIHLAMDAEPLQIEMPRPRMQKTPDPAIENRVEETDTLRDSRPYVPVRGKRGVVKRRTC